MNKLEAWERLKFNKIFRGNDWKNSPIYIETEKRLKEVGVESVYFEYTKDISSTIIKTRLDKNEEK